MTSPMLTFEDLRAAGYITDEWERWQQGFCDLYALALMDLYPALRFGVLLDSDWCERHFFAHDDQWAYDSAGRHPLPYYGVHGDLAHFEPDQDPEDYGVEDYSTASDLGAAAHAHIKRHHIGPN